MSVPPIVHNVKSAAAGASKVATKTVIVADDTAFVRDRFKAALEGAGHRVISVSSGTELVARVKSELSSIDLVVTVIVVLSPSVSVGRSCPSTISSTS